MHSMEVDSSMTIADLKALAEAEMRIPLADMILTHNGIELVDATKSITDAGIAPDDIILVTARTFAAAAPPDRAEQIRQQLLMDAAARQNVAVQNPELIAAINHPPEFRRILTALEVARQEAQRRMEQEQQYLQNADEFDVEAQKKIEAAIRKENIHRNLEMAMEMHPESFGRVVMLYIDTFVNGVPVKAFVDSGAQATIMSPSCAEKCMCLQTKKEDNLENISTVLLGKIMHLLDERFAGIAEGVGTAKILGRVHHAEIKVGQQSLDCSFTIMEGKGVELLFGLDQLRRHLACIDLAENCLKINGEKIPFLPEHELPDHAREKKRSIENESSHSSPPKLAAISQTGNPSSGSNSSSSRPTAAAASASASTRNGGQQNYPEEVIKGLMDLGVTREQAIQALDLHGGNADFAANSLF
ncbi:DNA damage-inducible protein 1 [Physocladia obscura]|uniref:DNA damage-inducible protein 1 n=1 Tax=Physocladia obscura TaxID=109957 RepID=A0AAD5SRH0_9FUNG|nr:DNA damage-inducible protein 1 [Physocladia obscura]